MDLDLDLEIHLTAKGTLNLPLSPRIASQKNTILTELSSLHDSSSSFQSLICHSHYIATHDLLNTIHIYNLHSNTFKSIQSSLQIDTFCFMTLNPDQIIITFVDKSIAIINWRTIAVIAQFEAPYRTNKIENIGSAIMVVLDSKNISMIDLNSRRLLRQLQLDDECVDISMDEATLFILTKKVGLTTYDLLTLTPQIRTVYKENT